MEVEWVAHGDERLVEQGREVGGERGLTQALQPTTRVRLCRQLREKKSMRMRFSYGREGGGE